MLNAWSGLSFVRIYSDSSLSRERSPAANTYDIIAPVLPCQYKRYDGTDNERDCQYASNDQEQCEDRCGKQENSIENRCFILTQDLRAFAALTADQTKNRKRQQQNDKTGGGQKRISDNAAK